MIVDQPENPRIRTKINRWNADDDATVFNILDALRHERISPDAAVDQLMTAFEAMHLSTSLADEIKQADGADDQLWLIRRHVDHRRYTVLLYPVAQAEVHPPHGHHNLISLQVVLKGKLHLREYDRVRREQDGQLIMKGTRETILGPGDVFVATDWKNNAHWFTAHEGPAVIFNINARGYSPSTFDEAEEHFGRRYMDPTTYRPDGTIEAEEFDEDEAERRFQGKALSNFEFRAPDGTTPKRLAIRI